MQDRQREVTLRFLAEPSDVNFGGKVHGGMVMKWIDQAGYAAAVGWSGAYCVTVAVEGIEFVQPILIGDMVRVRAPCLYRHIEHALRGGRHRTGSADGERASCDKLRDCVRRAGCAERATCSRAHVGADGRGRAVRSRLRAQIGGGVAQHARADPRTAGRGVAWLMAFRLDRAPAVPVLMSHRVDREDWAVPATLKPYLTLSSHRHTVPCDSQAHGPAHHLP